MCRQTREPTPHPAVVNVMSKELKKMTDAPGTEQKQPVARAARRIAAEDIRPGQFLARLRVSYEFATCAWTSVDLFSVPIDRPIKITFLPFRDLEPLQVQSICLPFVFCKNVWGKYELLDVRACELADVGAEFGQLVFEKFESKSKSKSKSRKREKKNMKQKKK